MGGRGKVACIKHQYIDWSYILLDFIEDFSAAVGVCDVDGVDVDFGFRILGLEVIPDFIQGFKFPPKNDDVRGAGYGEGLCDGFAYAFAATGDEDGLSGSRERGLSGIDGWVDCLVVAELEDRRRHVSCVGKNKKMQDEASFKGRSCKDCDS